MFATGNSQLAFVDALRRPRPLDVPWSRRRSSSTWTSTWASGPDHPAGFRHWIRDRIDEPAHPRAAHYLDGLAPPEEECERYAALLGRHPLDLCCLGIGENGHLAFNDPPVADFDDPLDVKVVELDEGCRRQQVDEGHFPTEADVPAEAVTVTIPALLRAGPGAGRGARGPQGRAGPRRARGPGDHGVPGLDPPAAPHATVFLDRRLGRPPRSLIPLGAPQTEGSPSQSVEERIGHVPVPLVLTVEGVVDQPVGGSVAVVDRPQPGHRPSAAATGKSRSSRPLTISRGRGATRAPRSACSIRPEHADEHLGAAHVPRHLVRLRPRGEVAAHHGGGHPTVGGGEEQGHGAPVGEAGHAHPRRVDQRVGAEHVERPAPGPRGSGSAGSIPP